MLITLNGRKWRKDEMSNTSLSIFISYVWMTILVVSGWGCSSSVAAMIVVILANILYIVVCVCPKEYLVVGVFSPLSYILKRLFEIAFLVGIYNSGYHVWAIIMGLLSIIANARVGEMLIKGEEDAN
jgi:hypothetical protein